MDEERLKHWHPLFMRALEILDEAQRATPRPLTWSFGGGTALMLRYRHRYSHDVDIFVSDPQWLGYLSPHANSAADDRCEQDLRGAGFLKLTYAEGEIDFVATGWLTDESTRMEMHFGRKVAVETEAEIIGKKVFHRGETFKTRDLYDLATVLELSPASLKPISPLLREKAPGILARMTANRVVMQREFDALEIYHAERSFDRCLEIVERTTIDGNLR